MRNGDKQFVLYSKKFVEEELKLPVGKYQIQWFDPIKGGELLEGSIKYIEGGNRALIGSPAYGLEQDWVCIINKL